MNKEDIRSLTRISRSLWGDLDHSLAMSEDTLTSVSLLNLSDDRTIERASKVMIERAEKNPPGMLRLHHPFFRLNPMERFLLTALHLEKWSYSRIARTLTIDRQLIEPWAWATRLKFCYQEADLQMEYPRGPATLGVSCPEYNASAPWTQRLLDDELGKRERMFLQNHLMACDQCRKSLDLTRKMIFKAESIIPIRENSIETELATDRMFQVWKHGEITFRPMNLSSTQSLFRFFSRPKVQLLVASVVVFCLYWFSHSSSKL